MLALIKDRLKKMIHLSKNAQYRFGEDSQLKDVNKLAEHLRNLLLNFSLSVTPPPLEGRTTIGSSNTPYKAV